MTITCCECLALLPEYLAQELSARQRAHCRWHLGWCPDCTRYLQSYQTTIALSKVAFAETGTSVPNAVLHEAFIQTLLSACTVER